MQDPQSLHKYLYVHGDPVMGNDPTGMFTAAQGLAALAIAVPVISMTINYVQSARYAANRQYEIAALYMLAGHVDAALALSAESTAGGGGGGGAAIVVSGGGEWHADVVR